MGQAQAMRSRLRMELHLEGSCQRAWWRQRLSRPLAPSGVKKSRPLIFVTPANDRLPILAPQIDKFMMQGIGGSSEHDGTSQAAGRGRQRREQQRRQQ